MTDLFMIVVELEYATPYHKFCKSMEEAKAECEPLKVHFGDHVRRISILPITVWSNDDISTLTYKEEVVYDCRKENA